MMNSRQVDDPRWDERPLLRLRSWKKGSPLYVHLLIFPFFIHTYIYLTPHIHVAFFDMMIHMYEWMDGFHNAELGAMPEFETHLKLGLISLQASATSKA